MPQTSILVYFNTEKDAELLAAIEARKGNGPMQPLYREAFEQYFLKGQVALTAITTGDRPGKEGKR